MLNEILKANGLEDNQVQAIMDSMKEAKVYTTKLENVDERYSKLKAQKQELETQVSERDIQLSELSKNNKDNAELINQIKDLQALNKQVQSDYEAKIQKIEFDNALDKTLSDAKCKNNTALKALLDMDSINYQEGKLNGLEEQLNALKGDCSYLFEDEKPQNTGGVGNFGRGTGKVGLTKEDFDKMTYQERNSLYLENKEAYLELSK